MLLIEVTDNQKPQYNDFVAATDSGSFLQSWEWGQWQARLGRAVYRFKIKDEGGQDLASVQLVKMPLPMGKHYLYAPYGPVFDGKFEIRNSKFEIIFKELKFKFPKAIFIRIESKNQSLPTNHYPLLTKSPNIQPGKTLIIDLQKSQDELLTEMHPKTRYNIKLAQKHGVTIQDEFGLTIGKGLYAKEAIELIYQTSKRQGYLAQGRSYFENLINFFAIQNSQGDLKLHIYKALYNQQLLASAIMIDFAGFRTYLFGGSSDRDKNVMAPYLLHWQAMQDAKNLGLRTYDFWGIETASGQTPGFVRFKLGFGGQELTYAGAYDLITQPAFYRIYNFARALNRGMNKLWRH